MPKTLKQLRGFLGLTGYYRKFVKDYASIAQPLTHLLRKDTPYEWKAEQQDALDKMKKIMTEAPVLVLPDPEKEFHIYTDASCYAVGAVLTQNDKPVAFISRALAGAETRYPTHEQETLAIIYALKQLRVYLDGRKFYVHTDCNDNRCELIITL